MLRLGYCRTESRPARFLARSTSTHRGGEVQRSYDLSEVDITFHVQSLNRKSIANFEVWAVKSHGNVVDGYKRILAHSMAKDITPLLAAKEYTETVCVSLDRGFFRKRVDHVQLYLGWIEFTDGTRWHVPLEL